MDFLTKSIFHLEKAKVIIVSGKERGRTSDMIWQVLSTSFIVKKFVNKIPNLFDVASNEVFIIETDFKNEVLSKSLVDLAKSSELAILIATNTGEMIADADQIVGNKEDATKINNFIPTMPSNSYLILNFDDPEVKKAGDGNNIKTITFGFQEGADLKASDVHTNTGTNYKINYKGNTIPIWQEKLFGKEYIYGGLAVGCVGIALGLNFVEISAKLKGCEPYSGG
ncbi:MAG: Mur ligase family protein [Candidatus Staskawiczbacteria bacterium]|jgi:UDP-N-acetylmuramate-alanine ligase